MRRRLRQVAYLLTAAFVAYCCMGFLKTRISPDPVRSDWLVTQPPPTAAGVADASGEPANGGDEIELRGVLSVHTGRSQDAEGTLEEVARAAADAQLDFVVLGDHVGDWLDPEQTALEPHHLEGVLLVPGVELPITDWGRSLAVGLDTVTRTWAAGPVALAERLGPQGGFLSVVHPRSPRARERWQDVHAPGADAWEVLDVSEQVRLRLREPWALYHALSFLSGQVGGWSHEALLRLNHEGLQGSGLMAYDSARASRPLSLTAGLNHHAKTRILGEPFPDFGSIFRTLVNHVELDAPLSRNPRFARDQVLTALRGGRAFVSLGAATQAEGFRFRAHTGAGVARSGDVVEWQPGAVLIVQAPPGAGAETWARMIGDGQEVGWFAIEAGEHVAVEAARPGIYRVELYRPGVSLARIGLGGRRFNMRPWILSNPIEFTQPSASLTVLTSG